MLTRTHASRDASLSVNFQAKESRQLTTFYDQKLLLKDTNLSYRQFETLQKEVAPKRPWNMAKLV
jgi:hypothetical protein